MKKLVNIACVLLIIFQANAQSIKIPLYEDGKIPFRGEDTLVPRITVYQPEKRIVNDIAVIVCSGGSYGGRANRVEGIPACEKLQAAGITAFLLDYRLPKGDRRVPFSDAQRALQIVRERSAEFGISPHKIGMLGFSAGGHLVSTVGTQFNKTYLSNPKNISLRPDFLVLVYPVISFADSLTHLQSRENLLGKDITATTIQKYSNELQVSDSTPPVYLSSGIDDKVVDVKNSLYFAAALRQHNVPVDIFLYEKGRHGYGVYNKEAKVQWIVDCIEWITKEKYKN